MQVLELRTICLDGLLKSVAPSNIFEYISFADSSDEESLMEACIQYGARNRCKQELMRHAEHAFCIYNQWHAFAMLHSSSSQMSTLLCSALVFGLPEMQHLMVSNSALAQEVIVAIAAPHKRKSRKRKVAE